MRPFVPVVQISRRVWEGDVDGDGRVMRCGVL